MKVKVFDESHEEDLENDINKFLEEKEIEVIDIKFSVSTSILVKSKYIAFQL